MAWFLDSIIKTSLLPPFSFWCRTKLGLRKNDWRARLASALQNWVCLFFKLGFGKVFKWEQSQGLWGEGGCVLYILPLKAQTIYENSSGRSHGPRGYWKQWNCDWVFLEYCILNCIMNVRLAFYLYIWRETAASLIFATYITSEIGACEFDSTGVMRWATLAHRCRLFIFGGFSF